MPEMNVVLQDAFPNIASKLYQSSMIVFVQGERARGVHLIKQGQVRLVLYSSNGQVVLERVHGPGDVLGLPAVFADNVYSMTAETITEAQLAFIPREQLMTAMSNNAELGYACLMMLSDEVRKARGVIATADAPLAMNA